MRWTRCCGSSRDAPRTYLGEIEGANLIKLHRQSGKVSYLVYPEFETDPHPALVRSVKLSLRTRAIDCLEYGSSPNPPILHRKECFLLPEHPLHRISAQDQRTCIASVRQARERRKRLETRKPFIATLRVNESRPAKLGQQPEASLAWWRGNPPCEA